MLRFGGAARVLPHRHGAIRELVGATLEELGDLTPHVLLTLYQAVLSSTHVQVHLVVLEIAVIHPYI